MALRDKWEDSVKWFVQFSDVSTPRVVKFEIAGLICVASSKVRFWIVFVAIGSEKL